ncbi:MAG: AtpZ/AtpI family protein [Pseudomonadota bacterium]
MAEEPDRDRLAQLEERIKAAQDAQAPAPRGKSKYTAASLAWRMVVELVVGMALGVGIGYGLDSLFGTLPIFLMIFAILGFAAGIRTMMRTADEVKNKRAEGALLGGRDEDTNGG